MTLITIGDYAPADEESWLRCRVLAFLHTAYYDDVLCAKPAYANPSIALVALIGTRSACSTSSWRRPRERSAHASPRLAV
jgi:hypothetical protein